MSVKVPIFKEKLEPQREDRSQFGIPTNLPDLAFLRKLSIEGRLRYFTVVDDTLTITPAIGDTVFIYKLILNSILNTPLFTFLNDGNVRLAVQSGTNTVRQIDIFDSLVGDGTKSITITSSAVSIRTTALGWVENTSRIRDPTV